MKPSDSEETVGVPPGAAQSQKLTGHSGHLPYNMDEVEPRLSENEMQFKYKALDLVRDVAGNNSEFSVLDFGCGRGEFLEMVVKEGLQCVGVDVDANCVALSSRYAPCYVATADTLLQVLANRTFDVVTALHVLEHLDDPKHTINQLKLVTRRWLILAVPNLATPVGLARKRIKPCNPGHVYGWDAGHFQNFIENKCGLRIERWIPDTVVLPRISGLAERLGFRRRLEYKVLPRLFPFLSVSLIVRCSR